jgi:tetratricopeptide (TPR) repeat protein
MGKKTRIAKKAHLEEPPLEIGEKSIMMRSVIERPKPHLAEIIIYGLVILLLMTGTYWRNRVWNSELELWTDCVKKSPNKDRPHNGLGNVFFNQGKYQEAANQYNEALRINPNYAEARYNIGNAYLMVGNRWLALEEYEILKRMNPNLANALYQKIK